MAQVETKGVAKSVSRGGWGSDADQEMSLREGTQISGVLNDGVSVVTGQLKGCQKYKATWNQGMFTIFLNGGEEEGLTRRAHWYGVSKRVIPTAALRDEYTYTIT